MRLPRLRRLGYPVVLKGVAEGVAHKSDLGLVHVGLRDPDAVAEAYAAVGCSRVVVQAMIAGDLEAIAGVTRAEGVGLVLIAGLGGIFAEALHDVATFPLPVSRSFIEAGLAKAPSAACWPARDGSTQTPPHAFVDLLMRLQTAALALGDRLEAIDINPVILGPAGAIAVDALVVPLGMPLAYRNHERSVYRHLSRPQQCRGRSRPGRKASRSNKASRCRWPLSTMKRCCRKSSARWRAIDDIGDGLFAVRIGLATGRWVRMPASSST